MSDRPKHQSAQKKTTQEDQELQDVTELEELQKQLQQAQENERRARADYQNLIRRNQEERASLIKLANKSLVSEMLQPLEHLSLAAQQLNDQGLNMVIVQLWRVLEGQGLKEINPEGKKFDWKTMEAVDKAAEDLVEDEAVVIKVIRKGFQLNGEVIQHAKVIVGKAEK